jgi:hypothetical protein
MLAIAKNENTTNKRLVILSSSLKKLGEFDHGVWPEKNGWPNNYFSAGCTPT